MTDQLATAAQALRITDTRYPWIQPTEDEAEVADLLAELSALHVQSGRRCTGCAEPWPCKGWLHGQELAVQWLGRAADRVYARAIKSAAADLAARTVAATKREQPDHTSYPRPVEQRDWSAPRGITDRKWNR